MNQVAPTNSSIAIFGTSADPPTIAHGKILSWLASSFDLVAVYASDNPFKEHSAALDQRSKMLQLLIDDLQAAQNNILLCQEISDRRSLKTVRKARQKWGDGVEFYLVIGSDLLVQLSSWYEIEQLLQEVQFVVVPRPGYPLEAEKLEFLNRQGGKYQIAPVNIPSISSTGYRVAGDEKILTPKVKEYIYQQNLY